MAFPMVDFDRFLFAFTIGSHILLVSVSITLSILISITEFLSIRYNDRYYGALARKLLRVFIVSFGVGTASGVVMAIELVNLFPGFMTLVSQTGVIAVFYVEIFAFFIETVFLVVYAYYRNSFTGKYTHWMLTLPIVAGTLASGALISMVNAWMNTPNGFNISNYLATGQITDVSPWAPFLTPSTVPEILHVLSMVVFAGAMLIGGYFAYRYLRSHSEEEKELFLKGLRLTTILSAVFVVLTIYSGINEITTLLTEQPLKYAAIELNPTPGSGFPEHIFGTIIGGKVVGGFDIPGLQSFLVQMETGITNLPGLSQYPQSEWPPLIIHTTFDIMVPSGFLMGFFLLVFTVMWLAGRKPYDNRLLSYGAQFLAPFALAIMELGWVTDEVGRQPWIVYNVMTVGEAANYSSALLVPGLAIIAFYLFLIPFTFYFFTRVFNGKSLERELKETSMGGGVNY